MLFRVLPGHARTLGRAPQADFIVDAPLLSRVHGRLVASHDAGLQFEDLKSTNGSFVNDRRVETSSLVHGDRLRMGGIELLVEWSETA